MIKLLILCILFSSCVVKHIPETKEIIPFDGTELLVVEIDSCEYLYGDWGNSYVLTHKGNCKYCLKKNVRE